MGDATKSLDILITTKAELAGAKALEQTLEQSIGRAKALGNLSEVKKLSGELDTVRGALKAATAGNQELADAEKEGAEATEFLHKNHRALHMLMHQIGGEAGHMGGALVSAFHGPVGPLLALAAVVKMSYDAFSEWDKNLDEIGEAAAHSPLSEALKKIGDDMETSRAKTEAYSASLAEIAKNEVTIAKALDSQLQLMHAIAAARASEAKSAEEHEKAKTARMAAAGQITPEQTVITETTNAIEAARAEAARKNKDQADEITAKQTALDAAGMKQRDLDKAAEIARQEYFAAQKHSDSTKDFGSEEFSKKLKEQQEQAEKMREEIEKDPAFKHREALQRQYDENPNGQTKANLDAAESDLRAPNILPGKNFMKSTKDLMDELEKLDALNQDMARAIRQYHATQTPESKNELDRKKHAADQTETAGIENAKEFEKLRNELNELRKTSNATQPIIEKELTERLATIMEQAVTKLYSQPRGGEVETGIHISDKVEGGKQVTEAQAQFVMALDRALGGQAKNLKEAADHLETFKDNTSAFFEAVVRLTSQGFTKQQQAIDQLYSIVNLL